jgi:hypothetical protein
MNVITRRGTLACAAVMLAAALTAGCQQNKSGSGSASRTDETAGSTKATHVPSDASRVAEGTNNGKLIHRALRPGTIWVQDSTTGGVIYSGKVRADSNVVIDAKADAVTVNDIQVRHAPHLNPDHRYRLYFRQD